MARALWSGTLSFGLVNVPVRLHSAVRDHDLHFHQLHEKDGARIETRRFCEQEDTEVPWEEIGRGYERKDGTQVVLTDEELEAVAPKRTRTIEIGAFVDVADIDPIFYDHPYYLAPGPGGAKPYRLLLEAMRETGKVAIARVVIRSKESLVAIRPSGDVLEMSTMLFADEVSDPSRIEEMPDADEVKTTDKELAIAKQLVESLAGPFEPEKYHDEYREQILSLIERKAAGEEVVVQETPEEEPAEVPDLMAALQASLDAVRGETGGTTSSSGRKKAPAKPRQKAASKG